MRQSFTLFFYGTLRAAEVRRAVLGADIPEDRLTPASLNGYQVRRVDGALYPMLVKSAGGRVTGMIAAGLNRDALARLDRFEGRHYSRHALSVVTDTGPVTADVYLPDEAMSAAEPWDFDIWYKRDMKSFLEREFSPAGVRPPGP